MYANHQFAAYVAEVAASTASIGSPVGRQHDGRHRHRDDDHDKGDGNDSSDPPCIESEQIGRSWGPELAQQAVRDEEAHHHEEHVDPDEDALRAGQPDARQDHGDDGDRAQAVDVAAVGSLESATGALARAIIGRPVPGLAS